MTSRRSKKLMSLVRRKVRASLFSSGGYEFGAITVIAAITGVLAGYAAIGFYLGIGEILNLAFGQHESELATGAAALPWYHIVAVPVIGGLIVGQLLRFLPGNQTRGVPNVIEAAALNESRLGLRHGLLSAGTTIISLGSGASMGREGPVVHLGATLAATITRLLHLNPAVARTLLGCGVASAVAASFNAPIAGVFFALEVIIGHYALHAFAPVVIAAIAGTLVSRAHLGNFPAFETAEYFIASFWEFPAFFILGIVAAITAVIFMSGMNWADQLRVRLSKIPYWLEPAIAGLFVGLIALNFPEILSVGYEATSKALNGEYGFELLVSLVIAKMVATIISFGGRFGGGVFSPSLFLGAMVGGAFGIAAGSVFPALASTPGLYAVVGMGAVASAVLGAPISTMLIVFEITGDYNVTIAVMIASAVSSMVTSAFYERSFFHMQLANRGVRLEGGRATYLLKSARVMHHMTRDFFTVRENELAIKARELLVAQGGGMLIVTDETGKMVGVLSFGQLPADIFEGDNALNHTVGEYMRETPRTVRADQPLQVALQKLEVSGEDILPVVSSEQQDVVVGLIRHRDVMKEYNRALLESQGGDMQIGRRR
ncbi:chloride channel protein [Kordiimonas gwangyangensis]|uniref:chloride channel protein n=2 Tax=Kordiimonas gwangyangensis TaxID=288022 RepID=UPI00035F0175|nr:chloride channel protein [Kordiimonas gwangyangensis]